VTSPAPAVTVAADLDGVFRAAAAEFQKASAGAVAARGVFRVALSGGSTPKGLYSLLAADDALRSAIAWDRAELFWSDERHVPPDHPESNYRMAQDSLLSRVPVRGDRVHRVRAEQPDAAVAAIAYEVEIRRTFDSYGEVPRFDLILLGLGADGHTASLFPGTPALAEGSRLVTAHHVETLGADRITMTFPLLNAARLIMFVVAGPDKAAAVRAVLQPDPHAPALPAGLVQPQDGELVWVLDRAAAGRL
jgi:6-phosphogluconolactonase